MGVRGLSEFMVVVVVAWVAALLQREEALRSGARVCGVVVLRPGWLVFEEPGGRVRAIQVSHSAYPSYAYVVETSEGTILYTGDFRVRSPRN